METAARYVAHPPVVDFPNKWRIDWWIKVQRKNTHIWYKVDRRKRGDKMYIRKYTFYKRLFPRTNRAWVTWFISVLSEYGLLYNVWTRSDGSTLYLYRPTDNYITRGWKTYGEFVHTLKSFAVIPDHEKYQKYLKHKEIWENQRKYEKGESEEREAWWDDDSIEFSDEKLRRKWLPKGLTISENFEEIIKGVNR